MWIKNIFKKEKLPPVPYPPPFSSNNQQPDNFENEDIEEDTNSSPLIDNTPDARYQQYQIIPHEGPIKFPLTILHPNQCILLNQSGLFEGSFMSDQNWEKVDLLLSDRQLAISPNILYPFAKMGLNFYSINYGCIEKCEVVSNKNKKEQTRLKITLKDSREFYLKCIIGDMVVKASDIIHKFGFATGINKFYAFRYGVINKILEEEYRGWEIYDIKAQFHRQGLRTHDEQGNILPLKYVSNANGSISPTYPQLLVIPQKITDSELKKCASFRTKQRFPALTYFMQYSTQKYSLLFRCSQNKVGVMGARSKEDEDMIKQIGQVTQKNSKVPKLITCKIYDARGYYAALGNLFAGKGFEKEQFYKNCEIQWLDIPNIHAVRDSYNKLFSLKNGQNFYYLIAESGWYDYLYLIISGAKSIAIDLLNGINVVVHCSDGWDRTSQLCALAQLILDPYYRTIQGFGILIEKDWRQFGHKFRDRTGQYRSTNYHPYEKSPIFIQFLDCIRQIMNVFPLSFEFNEKFLLELAKNVDSNIYGTFMTNNVQESISIKAKEKTISIWSHIRANIELYKNPYYRSDLSEIWLNAPTQAKNIYVWSELWMGDEQSGRMQYQMMNQFCEINKTLKSQFFNNEELIKSLEQEIAAE